MSFEREDDEQEQRRKQPAAGALPNAGQSYDWEAIWAYLRRRKGPFLAWSLMILVLVGLAIFFATRSLNATVAVPPQPLAVDVTPGAHGGQVPNTTPLPGAVATDANGNPIQAATDTTASVAPPPAGVDPADWQQYQNWRRCRGGQCSGQTQTQPQLTPAQQRAEERRKKLDDLMWQARESKPDAGIRKVAATQTPTTQNPASNEGAKQETGATPAQAPQTPEPVFVKRNTCGPAKGREYVLLGGISIIKARLLNAITGDAKGPVIAQVVEPTYNFDMTKALIPKGTYLTGGYDRAQELDQERILLNINAMTMPDGCQVKFDDVDVLDQTGMAGLRDKVNHHYAQIFLTSIAMASIGAGAQFGGGSSGYGYSPVDALRIGFGAGASQAAQQMFSRWANRRPTLTLRAGQEIVVFPPVDIPLGVWGDHHAHAL